MLLSEALKMTTQKTFYSQETFANEVKASASAVIKGEVRDG